MSGSDLRNGKVIWRSWETLLRRATKVIFPNVGLGKTLQRGRWGSWFFLGWGKRRGGALKLFKQEVPVMKGRVPFRCPRARTKSQCCGAGGSVRRGTDTSVSKRPGAFSGDQRKHSLLSLTIPAPSAHTARLRALGQYSSFSLHRTTFRRSSLPHLASSQA